MMSVKVLNISLLISLLLALSLFFLYRGTGWPLGTQGIEALAASALLLFVTGALLLYNSRGNRSYHKSILLGLLIGLVWTVEICINNILTPRLPTRDIIDDLLWAVVALIILAGSIHSAYQADDMCTGLQTGFWSGLGSGAVACLTGLLFVVIGMQFLLHDPLNRLEWAARGPTSSAPSITVYLAYETLAGSLLHLIVLGALMGLMLGLSGGIIGKVGSVLRQRRKVFQE